MESNRDAADQCYNKSLLALKQGDIEKAKRLAQALLGHNKISTKNWVNSTIFQFAINSAIL